MMMDFFPLKVDLDDFLIHPMPNDNSECRVVGVGTLNEKVEEQWRQ
jgi:hypothetical protein